jgi:large subunit ribosomal protein L31
MKAQGHPDYHFITVVMTDGTEFRTRSTMGQEGARLSLDIDPKTHPAWTGGEAKVAERGRASKFNQKFKGFLG